MRHRGQAEGGGAGGRPGTGAQEDEVGVQAGRAVRPVNGLFR